MFISYYNGPINSLLTIIIVATAVISEVAYREQVFILKSCSFWGKLNMVGRAGRERPYKRFGKVTKKTI